jgi:hypothetical protein
MELCSPLVIGMTRHEHDAHVAAAGEIDAKPLVVTAAAWNNTAGNDGLLPLSAATATTKTTVRFLVHGKVITPPAVDFPYFPLVESEEGASLVRIWKDSADKLGRAPLVVHQLCALQMFQSRMQKAK